MGMTKKHFKMIGHRGVQPCTDRESKEKGGMWAQPGNWV